jgi:plasmid segregation protein ParM
MALFPKRREAEIQPDAPPPPPAADGAQNPNTGEARVDVNGIDIGFGFTKAVQGRETIIFKSILGEAAEIQYSEALLDEAEKDEFLHLEFDGASHFVGELAERQSNVRFFTLDQEQFVSRFARPLAMTALGRLASSHLPINLVTGLPIGHYRRHKDDFSRMLTGKHAVTMIGRDGSRAEKSININKVMVVPQPFGSLFDTMLTDEGKLKDKRFLQDKIGVIDVGFRTCDYTVSDKMRYSERGSRTTESGIARGFNIIAGKLREKSGVNVELYRLYQAVEKGSIKIRGQEFDLKSLTEQVFKQLATTIANEVDRLWADDWDMDAMIITGGGGKVLEPFLKPQLTGEVLSAPEPDGDPRFRNVRGYGKYGRYKWGTATGGE